MLRTGRAGIVAFEFESSSSSAIYATLLDPNTGETSCNCRGWTFQRPGKPRGCKHTAQVSSGGNLAAQAVPVTPAAPFRPTATKDTRDFSNVVAVVRVRTRRMMEPEL